MQERLEEKRREQIQRLRKALTARKPAWKALRTAARSLFLLNLTHFYLINLITSF